MISTNTMDCTSQMNKRLSTLVTITIFMMTTVYIKQAIKIICYLNNSFSFPCFFSEYHIHFLHKADFFGSEEVV